MAVNGNNPLKKAEKKDFELLKPIKQAGDLLQPAEEGKPAVKVGLRKDQASRLIASGHVKEAA